jgi:hypothetical protein
LVAPGVDILSTTKNGDYGILSGTSMATPHVTGAAATIWSKNKKLTNNEVQNILEQTATPLGEQQKYGHGIVNLAKAVGIVDGPLFTPIPDKEQPNQENDTNEPFNIIEFDKNILSLSNQLNKLKEQALLENKIDLAKEIENKSNDLLVRNAALHRIPNENITLHKNDTNFTTLMNQHHTSNIPKYNQIQKEYEELIVNYFSNLNAISGQNVSIEAYNYVGDYQRIYPGQSATVSLNLYESKSWVDVRVYDIANNVVASTTYYNQPANVPIAFTWSTASNTPPGAYLIKYTYSGNAIVDTFVIHVDQPSQPLPPPYSSKLLLNSPIDVSTLDGEYKVFNFTPNTSGEYKFYTGPYGGAGATNDTVLELYSDEGLSSKIAENDDSNGGWYSEIKINLQAGITYYVKLRNYNTTLAVHARLIVVKNITIYNLSLNTPDDVSLPSGEFKAYQFTPSETNTYIFQTSSYENNGISNDTVLELYNDSNFSSQIAYNDDSNGLFSKIEINLNAGNTYYLKLRPYGTNALSARLKVEKKNILATPQITETEVDSLDQDVGFIGISWNEVPGAEGYKVWIYNGYEYQSFDVGNRTYWSTLGEGLYPTAAEISQGRYHFHTDGTGEEFPNDPVGIYQNGYQAGGFDYRNSNNYWFKVSAYASNNYSSLSNFVTPTIPVGESDDNYYPVDMDSVNTELEKSEEDDIDAPISQNGDVVAEGYVR